MAKFRNGHAAALALITSSLLAFVGCGGGDDDNADEDGGNGGVAGQPNGSGSGLPSRLPDDAAECASATGSDGCFFAECCSELVTCSENADCAKTFACYVSCPSADSNCFASCAGSALVNGGQDFAGALGCTAGSSVRCGGSEPGSGGGSGTGGSGGRGGTGNQGGSSNVGPLGSATDELGWNLKVSDDALTADLDADDDRAVSKQVTLDGGTLTATAEDGTSFKLTIPEGALYVPTLITLTPLRSFSVAAIDGDAHGVRIEPDGLALMGSPTLEITPPDGDTWSVEEQVPLAVTGENDTVSLALVDAESETLRLPLTHFSSYAVLLREKGLDSTLSAADIRNRFAGNVEERLQSAAAERLAAARRREFLGETTNIDEIGFGELAAEFEEHVLKPRIAQAGTSCAAGKLAFQTLLGFLRQNALLGVDHVSEHTIVELIPVVAEVCIREEYELCRDEHIITRAIPTLLGYMRQMELLGLGMEIDGVRVPPPWLLLAEQNVRKCLKFELQFDSSASYVSDSPGTSMSETVTARVPISYQASLVAVPEDGAPPASLALGALIIGEGQPPLVSTAYAVSTDEPCRTIDEENPEDGQLLVSFMGFTPAESTEEEPYISPELEDVGISIAISPNLSTYIFTSRRETDSGCAEVSATGEELLSWSSTVGGALLSEATENGDGENGAWLPDWEIVGGDIIATKDMTIGDDDGTGRGQVRMVLFHTPE
jgi:hypothetical protein